mmetsp:Transcript_6896/g.10404  ORF Transcript_6896/g.10404 Transcript_6896/m.10404 type:complete len:319 (-) Transcript_6896:152-1108(-)
MVVNTIVTAAKHVSLPLANILKLKAPIISGLGFSGAVVGGANLIGYGLTAVFETHKLTDLVGCGSFVINAVACAIKSGSWKQGFTSRPMVLNLCVGLWGSRLASYLFYRICQTGEDDRLAPFYRKEGEGRLDPNGAFYPVRLSTFWIIQGLWSWIVSFPVTMANFNPAPSPKLGVPGMMCLGAFLLGFTIEAVSDHQKWVFKSNPANAGQWIESGLWKYSRHPNYFGEMVVWWSILGMALPSLRGPKQLALGIFSPVFITSLLLFLSGVPLLEKKYDARYASNAAYQDYKAQTNLLIPWFPKSLKNDMDVQTSQKKDL